jgi:hypothetical protein
MPRPTVFLSSTFTDDFGFGRVEVPLRKRILEHEEALTVNVWAYEKIWGADLNSTPLDSDTVIDRCFAGIKACDLFVFIVTGRHGSGATLVEGGASASYLELELFAAAILGKPILVLQYRNREPEPLLGDAMRVLEQAFTSGAYLIDDEGGLFDHFQWACRALVTAGGASAGCKADLVLPEGLSLRRTKYRLEADLANPSLLFLNGQLSARGPRGDAGKARLLLDQVTAGTRTTGGEAKVMPHGAALFRLWAAMRELMDDGGRSLADPQVAVLWDRALGLWAGKASWFGLHGHTWMGPLAAINSQIDLRKQMATEPSFAADSDLREPLGSRASALYSIAQRMRTRRRKLFHYRQVVKLASEAMERDPTGRGGAISIRAHALAQMARLGHFWKLWEAKTEFERFLHLRETTGASEAHIGEAKADLGFLLVQMGNRRRGISVLQEGIAQLRSDKSANGQAFLARGLRKLARAARQTGRRELERAVRDELAAVSLGIEAIDQLRADQPN